MTEETKEEPIRHYYRGRVYDITGKIDLAIEEHLTAIRLGANYADIHNSLGKLYMKKQMYEEAISEFNLALELNPAYSEARLNLEKALEEHQKSKMKPRVEIKPPAVKEEFTPAAVKEDLTPVAVKSVSKLDFISLVRKYKLYLFFTILLVIGISFFIIKGYLKEEPEIVSVELPSIDISSFCIRKNEIWMSSWKEQTIYKSVLRKNLEVKEKIKLTIYPSFITFVNNKALITFDGLNRKLNFHVLDEYLTLSRQLEMPPIYPNSILFYDDYIFMVDTHSNSIYKLSKDLKIIDSYNPLREKIKIITHDGNNFIILDEENNLYLLDKNEPKGILKKFLLILPAGRKIKYMALTPKDIFIIFENEKMLFKLQRKYYLTPG